MTYFGITDTGKKRETNQDYFIIEQYDENKALFVLCDGMGGAAGGCEASRMCCTEFADGFNEGLNNGKHPSQNLADCLCYANEKVFRMSKLDPGLGGMGTTLVAVYFDGQKYHLLWVGDSRIYAIKDGKITQLSHDHSFVQTLVDNGTLKKEDAKNHPNRNIITKAVGIDSSCDYDISCVDKSGFDGLFLCSDGLSSYVDEEKIEAIIGQEYDVEMLCKKLVDEANSVGGFDNITVIAVKN